MSNPTILYSANTWLAYQIAKNFYQNEHWVWSSPHFDDGAVPSRDYGNPPSSTPGVIYQELRQAIRKGDRHSAKIAANRAGLLKGVVHKLKAGIIDEDQARELVSIVESAEIVEFRPLIYVIPVTEEVSVMMKPVPLQDRAHPFSSEFIIERLPRRFFDIIELP